MSPWFFAVVGYLLSRFAELRMHQLHYGYLFDRGAQESARSIAGWFYGLPLAFLFLGAFEMTRIPNAMSVDLTIFFYAGMLLSFAGRMWAVLSLGRAWTMKCLSYPGMKRVSSGPYRYFKHPEYVFRVSEVVFILLAGGAQQTALVALFSLGFLGSRLATAEEVWEPASQSHSAG